MLVLLYFYQVVSDSETAFITSIAVIVPAIEGAMKMRRGLKNNKRLDISYANALGYYLARQMGMKFLTGDKAFKTLVRMSSLFDDYDRNSSCLSPSSISRATI